MRVNQRRQLRTGKTAMTTTSPTGKRNLVRPTIARLANKGGTTTGTYDSGNRSVGRTTTTNTTLTNHRGGLRSKLPSAIVAKRLQGKPAVSRKPFTAKQQFRITKQGQPSPVKPEKN